MKKKILTVLLALAGATASAEEWRIFDQVGTPPNAAMICHLWNVKIFAPGEKPSCLIGTLFTVDLEKREIRYENEREVGLPRARADRDLERSTLINAMQGEGVAKLEELRAKLIAELDKQRAQAEADRVKTEYLASFEGANTLTKIRAFEIQYAENDPYGLIPKLQPQKERLRYAEYRASFETAKSSADLGKFVNDFASYDPDRLVAAAKERISQMQAQEQLERQRVERQRQEEQRQQDLATKQANADKDTNRLQYIQRLHSKYGRNIVAESPEVRQIVMDFKIDCRVPDGRLLPLSHVLYASIAYLDRMGAKLIFGIRGRGQEVRIYAETYKDGTLLAGPDLYYQLNKWGELRPVGITTEAVLNNCIGSHGPLWLMPGEQGY